VKHNHPKFTEPKELVVLVDVDGDPIDLCFPNDDVIQACIRQLDKNNPGDVPHTAWIWGDGKWRKWV